MKRPETSKIIFGVLLIIIIALSSYIWVINSQIDKLQNQNNILQNQNTALTNQTNLVQNNNSQLQNQVNALQENVSKFQNQTIALQDQNNELYDQTVALQEQNNELQNQTDSLQTQIALLQNQTLDGIISNLDVKIANLSSPSVVTSGQVSASYWYFQVTVQNEGNKTVSGLVLKGTLKEINGPSYAYENGSFSINAGETKVVYVNKQVPEFIGDIQGLLRLDVRLTLPEVVLDTRTYP